MCALLLGTSGYIDCYISQPCLILYSKSNQVQLLHRSTHLGPRWPNSLLRYMKQNFQSLKQILTKYQTHHCAGLIISLNFMKSTTCNMVLLIFSFVWFWCTINITYFLTEITFASLKDIWGIFSWNILVENYNVVKIALSQLFKGVTTKNTSTKFPFNYFFLKIWQMTICTRKPSLFIRL